MMMVQYMLDRNQPVEISGIPSVLNDFHREHGFPGGEDVRALLAIVDPSPANPPWIEFAPEDQMDWRVRGQSRDGR
jgi:hypothetical protein